MNLVLEPLDYSYYLKQLYVKYNLTSKDNPFHIEEIKNFLKSINVGKITSRLGGHSRTYVSPSYI